MGCLQFWKRWSERREGEVGGGQKKDEEEEKEEKEEWVTVTLPTNQRNRVT